MSLGNKIFHNREYAGKFFRTFVPGIKISE